MLRSGAFWVGVGAGALATWLVARRRFQLVAATPYYPRNLRRMGRRGAGWSGQGTAYRA